MREAIGIIIIYLGIAHFIGFITNADMKAVLAIDLFLITIAIGAGLIAGL